MVGTGWSYDEAAKTLTVQGSFEWGKYTNSTRPPWSAYEKEMTAVVVESGVTKIADYAFYGCAALCNVSLPDGLSYVGNQGFSACRALTALELPQRVWYIGDYAFSECYNLAEFTIPEKVTSIGTGAFMGCAKITSFVIPSGVKKIKTFTFNSCRALTSVTIPDSVTEMEASVFGNCIALGEIVLPDSLSEIAPYMFYECEALATVTIPNSIVTIGQNVFSGCKALATVNYTGSEAEYNAITIGANNAPLAAATKVYNFGPVMTSLAVTPPDKVTYLPGEALDLTGLVVTAGYDDGTSKALRESKYTVSGYDANTVGVQYLAVSAGVLTTHFAVTVTMVLEGNGWRYDDTTKVITVHGDFRWDTEVVSGWEQTVTPWDDYRERFEKVVIEPGNTEVAYGAFVYCKNLKEVVLPQGLLLLGNAFWYCNNIEKMDFPDGLEELGGFPSCKITSVKLPTSVKEIGDAFAYSETVKTVDLYGTQITALVKNAMCNGWELATVNLGGSKLKTIGQGAFSSNNALTEITLPACLESVGENAFSDTTLATVKFEGTRTQWDALTIESGNDALLNAELVFVTKPVEAIAVTPPKKTAYRKGEALDLAGFAVVATYRDGTHGDVTDGAVLSGYDGGTSGVQDVAVEACGKTGSFTVYVYSTVTAARCDEAVKYSAVFGYAPKSVLCTAVVDDGTTLTTAMDCAEILWDKTPESGVHSGRLPFGDGVFAAVTIEVWNADPLASDTFVVATKRLEVLDAQDRLIALLTEADGTKDATVSWTLNDVGTLEFSLPKSCNKAAMAAAIENSIRADGVVYTSRNDESVTETRDENGNLWLRFNLNDRFANESRCLLPTVYNTMDGLSAVATHTVNLVTYPDGEIAWDGGTADSKTAVAVRNHGTDSIDAVAVPEGFVPGTARYALYFLLAGGTGWSVDERVAADLWPQEVFDFTMERKTLYDTLQEMRESYGGIFLVDTVNRKLALVDEDRWMPENALTVRYRNGLKSISRKENREIYTRIYPYGADGITLKTDNYTAEYVDCGVETYGVIEKTEENANINNQTTLLAWGQKRAALLSRVRYSYDCAVVTRAAVRNELMAGFVRGGSVSVLDPDVTGGVVVQRAIAGSYDFFDESAALQFSLGDRSEDFIGIIKDLKKATATNTTVTTTQPDYSGLDFSEFNADYGQFQVDYGEFNTDLGAFNLDYGQFNADLGTFNANYGAFMNKAGFNVVSVAALPASPDPNTLYLIQGTVVVN